MAFLLEGRCPVGGESEKETPGELEEAADAAGGAAGKADESKIEAATAAGSAAGSTPSAKDKAAGALREASPSTSTRVSDTSCVKHLTARLYGFVYRSNTRSLTTGMITHRRDNLKRNGRGLGQHTARNGDRTCPLVLTH